MVILVWIVFGVLMASLMWACDKGFDYGMFVSALIWIGSLMVATFAFVLALMISVGAI